MKQQKALGYIGRVDLDHELFDGQTVKTRTIYELMVNHYGQDQILLVETKDYRSRPFKVLSSLLKCIHQNDDIVIQVSANGRRVFFPILYIAAKVFRKRIYHNLIGGSLADDLNAHPSWVRFMNTFRVNWVESKTLAARLSDAGVTNAKFLPNFKVIEPLTPDQIRPLNAKNRKFCTFSRVTKSKGIQEAIAATRQLNVMSDGINYTLDIFGPIDQDFEREFLQLVSEHPEVEYRGVVDPNDSVNTLKDFDALLFPTTWPSEGHPGTVLDSLHAGLPVIASRWRYYEEVLQDGTTGFSYDFERPELLAQTIGKLPTDPSSYRELRLSCLNFAAKFDYRKNFAEITETIDTYRSS